MKEQRTELVTLTRKPEANISELARRFGLSRKTIYRWLNRDSIPLTEAQQQEVNLSGSGCATNGYSLGRYPLAPVAGQHSCQPDNHQQFPVFSFLKQQDVTHQIGGRKTWRTLYKPEIKT